jgi:hypothetical protein
LTVCVLARFKVGKGQAAVDRNIHVIIQFSVRGMPRRNSYIPATVSVFTCENDGTFEAGVFPFSFDLERLNW